MESQSKDDEVYFAVEATDAKGLDKTIEEAVEYLKEQGVTIDLKTQKQTEAKVNGMDGVNLTWNGKRDRCRCRYENPRRISPAGAPFNYQPPATLRSSLI